MLFIRRNFSPKAEKKKPNLLATPLIIDLRGLKACWTALVTFPPSRPYISHLFFKSVLC